jgi:hypothetical protein
MRKLAALVTVAALCVVGTAQAERAKPPNSPKPPKAQPHKTPKPAKPNPARCVARNEGYNASGKLVIAKLTAQGHGRYSGTLEVTVTKANHRAPTRTTQEFTLSGARVEFHHGVNPASPPAGSRVKLSGKITELPNKHCSSAGFTPTITLDKVDVRAAKH